jgi:hypothetical protein
VTGNRFRSWNWSADVRRRSPIGPSILARPEEPRSTSHCCGVVRRTRAPAVDRLRTIHRIDISATRCLAELRDNQEWNYLVEPPGDQRLGLPLEGLRAALNIGEIEVIGSIDLLQEIIAAAPNHETKYTSMVDVYIELVGHRLLQPLNRRHTAEVVAGGLLPETARYLDRDTRRELKRAAYKRRDVIEIAGMIRDDADKFRDDEVELRTKAADALAEAGRPVAPKIMREWYATVDLDDWLQSVVEGGVDRGEYTHDAATGVGRARFPSAWTFIACRLARLVYTLGEGRKIKWSDLADLHHASTGPYIDILVTDDQPLIDALELIPQPLPFTWMTSEAFRRVHLQ